MPQPDVEAARALRHIADQLEHLVRAATELRDTIADSTGRIEAALEAIGKIIGEDGT